MPTQVADPPCEALRQVGAKEAASQQILTSGEDAVSVWSDNLDEEMERMAALSEDYNYIALDAQFPGLVALPAGPFGNYADYNYQTLRLNVELTKVIQIGFSFMDENGNRPDDGPSTWRFNFQFNPQEDLLSQDPIDTRRRSMPRNLYEGLDPSAFAEALTGSGIVLNEEIHWIAYSATTDFFKKSGVGPVSKQEAPWVTFAAMYDFGHLIKLLTEESLPAQAPTFMESLDMFFPTRCDLSKYVESVPTLRKFTKQRTFFRKAHHLLTVFFHLPESVRRTAFDPGEEDPESEQQTEQTTASEKSGHHGLAFQ
mmetsp:Transcript_49484/g.106597  ORF Transcript_49484/g.106597 Transcript_49484/m.106597 type:complete len:312 (-) Transcript_49484:84-1019(-)